MYPNSNKSGESRWNLDRVPAFLKELPQWVLWRHEERGGKTTKVPYQVNGIPARTNDASTWTDFTAVEQAFLAGGFDGIGFVFAKGDGITGIDLDHCFDEQGQLEPWAKAILDTLAVTYQELSPSRDGVHIFGLGIPATTGSKKWKRADGTEQGIEVYSYTSPRYFTVTGLALNDAGIADCQTGLDWLYEQYWTMKHDEPKEARTGNGAIDIELVRRALAVIPADDYRSWIEIGMALKAGGVQCDVWEEWSEKSEKHSLGECQKKWATFNPTQLGMGTLFFRAMEHGFQFPRKQFRCDDIGNSERLVHQFGGALRWYGAKKRWLYWTGQLWKEDDCDRAMAMSKETARRILLEAASCEDPEVRKALTGWAKQSASAKHLDAMLKLARPNLAIDATRLDRDQFKLNVLNGTIDLKTGIIHAHSAQDYITKIAPVIYNTAATCPRFEQFISETFAGSELLIEFVQAVLGYSLTGSVKEQKLFVCYGTGQNGKSTLFAVLREILGDYAQETDPTLLTAKKYKGAASEDVARLQGTRLATTIETNEDERMDEAKAKQLTGGDRLAARFLYGHTTEFQPSHKLFLISNYKPQISSQSDAIWRRIKLIPFTVRVPNEKMDKDLPDKLRAEDAGIMAWLVRGCRQWQEQGLPEPPAVENATAGYKAEMDSLENFLNDCCRQDSEASIRASLLRETYSRWCQRAGEVELNRNAFTNRMREKGFFDKKRSSGNVWCGLSLLTFAEASLSA